MPIIKTTTLAGEKEPYRYIFVTDNGTEFDFPSERLSEVITKEKPTCIEHNTDFDITLKAISLELIADEAMSEYLNKEFKYPVMMHVHPNTAKQLWDELRGKINMQWGDDQRLIKYKGIGVFENPKVEEGKFIIE